VSRSTSTRPTALLHARGAAPRGAARLAGAYATRAARRGRPGVVTYSRKVFVPLTRLCRDRCHYCTFATVPGRCARRGTGRSSPPTRCSRSPREGAALGCKEALFTLGRPARGPLAGGAGVARRPRLRLDTCPTCARWPSWCSRRPACCRTSTPASCRGRSCSGSSRWRRAMGMMLETTATRLWSEPGGPHFGSPTRTRRCGCGCSRTPGRQSIPFTTGVLLGIGETAPSASSRCSRSAASRGATGTCRRSSSRTSAPSPTPRCARRRPRARGVPRGGRRHPARARPAMRVQAPPNLVRPDELALLLAPGSTTGAGCRPLTPDHVNPERPWPHLDDLARLTAAPGSTLRERLTAHPEYVRARRAVARPAGPPARRGARRPGRARERGRPPDRLPWQEPDGGVGAAHGRAHRPARDHRHRGSHAPTAAATSTRSTATGTRCASALGRGGRARPVRADADVRAARARRRARPAGRGPERRPTTRRSRC
jgi:FO synthase